MERKRCIDCGKPLSAGSQYRKDGAPKQCQPCYWKTLNKPKKLCVDCGKVLPRRSATRCLACSAIHRRTPSKPIFCKDCGKRLNIKYRYTKAERCKPCKDKTIIGPNHPNWNGGSTPMRKQVQNSQEYKTWRSSVFASDDFTCCICGRRGRHLHAHHIMSFAEHPALRTEKSNGATLCVPCHKQLHRELRRA